MSCIFLLWMENASRFKRKKGHSYVCSGCKSHKGSKLLLDDPNPTWESDVKVVDILRINMCL